MDKKKFKDTRFAKFLKKAGEKVPEIGGAVIDFVQGDIGDGLEKVGEILTGKAKFNADAEKLRQEWEREKMNFQKELIALENADRADARKMNAELSKALGKQDPLYLVSGFAGLGLLIGVVAYGLFYNVENKEVYLHILGIAEGVGLSIFAYQFGSSKGSKEKQKQLEELLDK